MMLTSSACNNSIKWMRKLKKMRQVRETGDSRSEESGGASDNDTEFDNQRSEDSASENGEEDPIVNDKVNEKLTLKIFKFPKNRPTRKGRQKYTNSEGLMKWLAELYVKNMNGEVSLLRNEVR